MSMFIDDSNDSVRQDLLKEKKKRFELEQRCKELMAAIHKLNPSVAAELHRQHTLKDAQSKQPVKKNAPPKQSSHVRTPSSGQSIFFGREEEDDVDDLLYTALSNNKDKPTRVSDQEDTIVDYINSAEQIEKDLK